MTQEHREISAQTRVFTVAAVLLAAAHFVFLMWFFEPATSARDANAYFVQARQLATTGRPYVDVESSTQFVDYHWMPAGENRYYSKYPPGLPAVLAAAFKAGGPGAMMLVNPLMTSLTLLALFFLCRRWIGPWWGLAATALLALNPLANKHALYYDSHAACTFFLMWALLLIVNWSKTRRTLPLLAAGLLAGMIPAVRYSEVLFLPAFAMFALVMSRGRRDAFRNIALFAAGAAIPILCLCIHNHAAYGAFWKTGYAAEAGAFSWEYFRQSFPSYPQRMMAEGGAYVFVLGIFGIAALCARREYWKQGALLAGLIVPVTLMYMMFFTAPYAPIRYLLPTVPLYIVSAVWLLRLLAREYRSAAVASAIVILLVTAYWGLPASLTELKSLERRHGGLVLATRMVLQHVPRGSVLVADEGICQQLDNYGRWRLAEEAIVMRRGRPPRALPGIHESNLVPARRREQEKRYGGMPLPRLMAAFRRDVFAWAGRRREVFWVTTPDRIETFTGDDPKSYGLSPFRELRIPLPTRRPHAHVPGRTPGEDADPRYHSTRPGTLLVLYRWDNKK